MAAPSSFFLQPTRKHNKQVYVTELRLLQLTQTACLFPFLSILTYVRFPLHPTSPFRWPQLHYGQATSALLISTSSWPVPSFTCSGGSLDTVAAMLSSCTESVVILQPIVDRAAVKRSLSGFCGRANDRSEHLAGVCHQHLWLIFPSIQWSTNSESFRSLYRNSHVGFA